MVPIKDQLMAMIRDLGGEINENDCRIPALLKQLNELLAGPDIEDPDPVPEPGPEPPDVA